MLIFVRKYVIYKAQLIMLCFCFCKIKDKLMDQSFFFTFQTRKVYEMYKRMCLLSKSNLDYFCIEL